MHDVRFFSKSSRESCEIDIDISKVEEGLQMV